VGVDVFGYVGALIHRVAQGFYSVYDSVFNRIADEEEEYSTDDSERLPRFGECIKK